MTAPVREYNPAHPTTDYAIKVTHGDILAGQRVIDACHRHLQDLGRSSYGDTQLWFDESAADVAFRYFERLRHWKGAMAGGPCFACNTTGLLADGTTCQGCEGAGQVEARPFSLERWQQFIIGSLFGWKRPDGLRRFRTAYCETGKGNGKTLLASGVAGMLALVDNEPGAEVYCAATKLDQAKLVFTDCTKTLKASDFSDLLEFYATTIFCPENNGRIIPLGADKSTTDGINPSGAIIDELHAHKSGGLLQIIRKSMVKRRQPLLFMITNSGTDRLSVCWEQHEYTERVNNGSITDESHFGYISSVDDDDHPLEDYTCLAKANPNLGVSVGEEGLRREQQMAQEMPSEVADFLRFHAGRWVWGVNRAISDQVWGEQAPLTPSRHLLGRACWGGLDLAQSWDINALVLVFPDEGLGAVDLEADADGAAKGEWREGPGVDLLCWFWCPEDIVAQRAQKGLTYYQTWVEQGWLRTTPGSTTDYDFIEAMVVKLAGQFDIQQLAYDPHNANQTAIHLADDHGLNMLRFTQGFNMMAAPTKRLLELVQARRFRHGDNPVLTWMASNLEVKENEYQEKKIVKPKNTGHTGADNVGGPKVDGMVAAAMGLGSYLMQEQEEQEPGSVYDRDDNDGIRSV